MATGTLQVSGDEAAQIEQMITTLGGSFTSAGRTDLLKALNSAIAGYQAQGSTLAIAPSTAVAETIPRAVGAQSVTIATVSGTIYMQGIYIPNNTVVNNINVVLGSTASSNDVTINWAALCSSARVVLAVSANSTAQLTPAASVVTTPLSAAFTTTAAGFYYIAWTVGVTTTQPTLTGVTAAGTELTKIAPILAGTSSTTATSTPPAVGATLGALTATANNIYEYLT